MVWINVETKSAIKMLASGLLFGGLIVGCSTGTPTPTASRSASIAGALTRESPRPGLMVARTITAPSSSVPNQPPDFVDSRTSVVLSFDSPADAVFVLANSCSVARQTDEKAGSFLDVAGEELKIGFRIGAAVRGRAFPANWTAVALRVRSPQASTATATLLDASGKLISRSESILTTPQGWTNVVVNIPDDFPQNAVEGLVLEVRIQSQIAPSSSSVIKASIDDVVLLDNGRSVRTTGLSALRRGTVWRITSEDLAEFVGSELSSANPLRLIEWSKARVVFQSLRDPAKFISIDYLGRRFDGGEYRFVGKGQAKSTWQLAHLSPGVVEIDPDQGRVERQAPGDRNQDGYDESRGSYRVHALAARLDVRIAPRSVGLDNAVIEITGLEHAQEIQASVSGQIVRRVDRSTSGAVLVELETRVETPIVLQVRTK